MENPCVKFFQMLFCIYTLQDTASVRLQLVAPAFVLATAAQYGEKKTHHTDRQGRSLA